MGPGVLGAGQRKQGADREALLQSFSIYADTTNRELVGGRGYGTLAKH